MRAVRFLMSTIVWAMLTCGPALGVVRKFGPASDYLSVLLFLWFGSAVEAGLLWSLVAQAKNLSGAVMWGVSLGFLVPSVWGYLLAKDLGAFDAQPLIVMGFYISFPSAVGGAFAGWIQWRTKISARIKQASASGG
jgi:hypothetical protein